MDQDTLDKLASGEYSISPSTGRLRKKIRRRKQEKFFSRPGVKNSINTGLWVLLIAVFVMCLVIVFPELNLVSSKKKVDDKSNNK